MKLLLTILITLSVSLCFGQMPQQSTAEYNLTIPYQPATIQLIADTIFPPITVNSTYKIIGSQIKPGHYKLQISGQGQTTFIRDSLIVRDGQRLVLNLRIDGPCLYDHPAGYVPVCPRNHKDNIIPIIYGMIFKLKRPCESDEEDLTIREGGCVMTGCDPQFYCKIHDIEF